jgi:hypothetical protein
MPLGHHIEGRLQIFPVHIRVGCAVTNTSDYYIAVFITDVKGCEKEATGCNNHKKIFFLSSV